MIGLLKRLFGFSAAAATFGTSTALAQPETSLDAQIATFADVGLRMAEGRTKAELLQSFEASEFEDDPFFLLLFAYGSEVESEPWGRYFSDQVWNFDLEYIQDEQSYPDILKRMAVISGTEHLLSDVSSQLDWDAQTVSVSYKLGQVERSLAPKFESDWADPETIQQFVADFVATTNDGRQFWAADNGQAAVLVYLNDDDAAKLNALAPDLVSRWE